MLRRILLMALTLVFTTSPLWGATITIPAGEFKKTSEELGAVLAYRNVAPASALGVSGFDVGVDISAIDVSSSFQIDNSSYSSVYMTRARARVGLPWGVNVGGMMGWSPNTLTKLYGFEVGKELLSDGLVTPALGIRGTYSRLNGLDGLSIYSWGADATVSKKILFITPYVGLGPQWISSTYTGVPREEFWQMRYFGGVEIIPFPLFRVSAEVEREVKWTYSLKVAIGF
jgi:hypothetical protein